MSVSGLLTLLGGSVTSCSAEQNKDYLTHAIFLIEDYVKKKRLKGLELALRAVFSLSYSKLEGYSTHREKSLFGQPLIFSTLACLEVWHYCPPLCPSHTELRAGRPSPAGTQARRTHKISL